MITLSGTLANDVLTLGTTKQAYSNVVINHLGANRRLVLKKDNVVCIDAVLTGDIKTLAGNVVSFGKISHASVHTAMDVTSGACTLEVTNGTDYIRGTFGLSKDAQISRSIASGMTVDAANAAVVLYDFTVADNLTLTSGLAVLSSFNVQAPIFLPSGTGPAAPLKTLDAPNILRIYDWANPSAPVLALTMSLSSRKLDFVYQDSELANATGDAAVYQTPADGVWGNFLFGATLTISNPSNTVDGTVPLYQVLVALAHTYSGYPDITNYNKKTTILNLPPFKATISDGNDHLLYTWEMPDGSAINDPNLLSEVDRTGLSSTKPLNPKFNCRMGLFWENTKPSMTAIARKIYPGVRSDYRPSMAKTNTTIGSTEPLITGGNGGNQKNSLASYLYATPQPLPAVFHAITDPYLAQDVNRPGSSSLYAGWIQGYDYAPGAYGLHNWYTGPGGPRTDRCVISSTFVTFLTNPTGYRTQDNTPYRDMADGFRKNFWNHSNLLVSSPSSLYLDTNAALMDGVSWAATGNYYGDYPYTGKAYMMNSNMPSGANDSNYDANNDLIINGWGRDGLHTYAHRGTGALFFNSPMNAIGNKFDAFTAFTNYRGPDGNPEGDYQVRSQAWNWLNHVIAWKLGSAHPLGISQNDIEVRFDKLLYAIYINVYKPAFIDNSQSVFSTSLRNLGINVRSDGQYWYTPGGRLGLYMGYVMILMKQTGFWSRMRQRNPINAIVLENLIRNWDKFCFDSILDSDGVCGFGDKYFFAPVANPEQIATSWADWQTNHRAGQTGDFIHNADGSVNPNPDVSSHHFEAYIRMRPEYFPEYPNPRMADAVAKMDYYAAIVKARVDAEPDLATKSKLDYDNRYHGIAPVAPPTILGPQ